jgi:glycolate oxidase iron-sulfur subunit
MSADQTLKSMDYSVLQQCMHCGMCLPTCPTYDATKLERNSPRGRISLMRAIADGDLEATKTFADEMYFCLGCLACESACPAGVDYAHMFEIARSDSENSGTLDNPQRRLIRAFTLRGLFMRPRILRLVGRMLWLWQASGAQALVRKLKLTALLPGKFRELEPQTPTVCSHFSNQLIQQVESPNNPKYRVGMLTGCVQDLAFSDVNRDTVDVLLANHCSVETPGVQACCGSLHAHNGELTSSMELARRLLDTFDVMNLDAIISNAAGCGSHLKTYGRLLANDPVYAERAAAWSQKLKDVHEWLSEIGVRAPASTGVPTRVTYHEACHLVHGQKISRQPREILNVIPGLQLVELPESTWCCGSAGIYNITQPEMSAKLQTRKIDNIRSTGVSVVATSNPGCHLQLVNGAKQQGLLLEVIQPVTLLARAYRAEK